MPPVEACVLRFAPELPEQPELHSGARSTSAARAKPGLPGGRGVAPRTCARSPILPPAAMLEPVPEGTLMKFAYGWALLAGCVGLHAAGLITLSGWLGKAGELHSQRFLLRLWRLVRMAGAIILLHMLQILFWALFYMWKDCMPDLSTAFYFSAVTYTTVGYGDLVLPPEWRNMAGVEPLTGILMAGLSTGFFFMALNRMFEEQ